MKRKIRHGVFETNSSSMHSLVVMRTDEKYTSAEFVNGIYLCRDTETGEKDCVWNIHEDDLYFGRSPFRSLGTFKDKWLYACASLVLEYGDETYNELISIALKYVPGLKKIVLPTSVKSIPDKNTHKDDWYFQEYGKTEDEFMEYLSQKEKDLGAEIEYWKTDLEYWKFEYPYTGSCDSDILTHFLEKEGITLEEYLINKKYVVIQDGDEYCYWYDMKRTGLINEAVIDYEY